MHFPISGVEVSPLVPVLVGLAVATLTTPAGVSGAFLLLPFQVSVLGFVAPGVTPTNLLYNVISTPGGITRYRQQGSLDRNLVGAIVTGAIPGIIGGSILRITVLAEPGPFKVFAGVVLLALGVNLIVQNLAVRNVALERSAHRPQEPPTRGTFSRGRVSLLGAGAGLIGGIYGISGGSIIAPVLAGAFHLSVRRVAPAALIATLITSLAGVASFLILDALSAGNDPSVRPDWLLAALFGVGGAMGGQLGARLNLRLPERGLRSLLGALAATLGAFYVAPAL